MNVLIPEIAESVIIFFMLKNLRKKEDHYCVEAVKHSHNKQIVNIHMAFLSTHHNCLRVML